MSDRDQLARELVRAFNINGPDFDHVSETHRAAAYRMADAVEGFYNERLGTAYYDGFVECSKRTPWDDMFDWAAVKGRHYALSLLSSDRKTDSPNEVSAGNPVVDEPILSPLPDGGRG